MVILVVVIALLAVVGFNAGTLLARRAGRWLLLVGLAVVPLALSGTGVTVGLHASTRTSFCMSCHEMEPFAKSLFVDRPHALAAMHYQKRLIDRDSVCYSCHSDYAMFGDAKAKLNGLRHVWVHYFGTPPTQFALYAPYPNQNCLHCHDDARSFLEKKPHLDFLAALRSGERSCLTCHGVVHDLDAVDAGAFWVAP